jgi:hypothetical protein
LTTINASDASNAAVDSASVTSGTTIATSDVSGRAAENSAATVKSSANVINSIPYAAAIPGLLPGSFTTFGLYANPNSGASFKTPELTGLLPSTLPFALCSYMGQDSKELSPNYVQGVGWEVKVFDGRNYTYQTVLPRYESLAFNLALSDEGAGQIVIDRSDAVFQETLATGGPGTDLLDYENFWQVSYNGEPIFEFLGTTVEETIVDSGSESQPITISGAGNARVLKWACAEPPGFPNVIYKLAALTDSFQIPAINPVTWNLTTAASINNSQVYVDTSNAAAAITGAPTSYLASPALSAGYYDATASAMWALITPLNMPVQPTNLIANYSFELGLSSWDTGSSGAQSLGAQAVSYNADSFDGDGWCAQITASGPNQGIEQTVPALQPNTYYQMNAWIKQASGTPTPTVTLHDSTNNKSSFPGTITSQLGEWVLVQASIKTGPVSNVNLVCSVNSGTGACTFLADTCFLYQYTPYTSTAMIISNQTNPTTDYVMIELDMYESNPRFWARVFNNGVPTSVYLTTTYDPVQHGYWRIREYNGVFYFDTAPDGATWTNQGQLSYSWNAQDTAVSFTCWYYGGYGATPGFTPMEVSQINTAGAATVYANGQLPATINPGSSTNYNLAQGSGVGLSNAYLEVPNAALWLDLLKQSQRRGTIQFVNPTFDNMTDSFGIPWTDVASIVIANGTDLETQYAASVTAFNGDWLMMPNFQLIAGNDGSLGNDLSSTVVFYTSGQIQEYTRTRARDQIANYIVASDGTGNLQYQTSGSSEVLWTQRENYVQAAQATDNATLAQMVNAAVQEFEFEISQRTLQVPPDLPGLVLFEDYTLGDWIGIQNPDLTSVDSVRVVGASVSIDGTQDLVTVELTLETRIQLFVERMNVLLQKIGANADAQVLTAPGAASQIILQSVNSTAVNTFTQTFGDGSTTTFFIGHGLGTQNVSVTVRNNTSTPTPGAFLTQTSTNPPTVAGTYAVTANSLNQVTLVFPTAPAANQYTVVVKK